MISNIKQLAIFILMATVLSSVVMTGLYFACYSVVGHDYTIDILSLLSVPVGGFSAIFTLMVIDK